MTKFPTEIETVRGLLAAASEARDPDISVPDLRLSYEAMGAAMPVAEGVKVEAATLGGVPGLKMVPANAVAGRVLLYFHGGGYVIGSSGSHKGMVSEVARAMRATVYSMDYRMAPEAPFPAAHDDGLAAYRALLEAGVGAEGIVISGDSAGGGLALATTIRIREAGLDLPAALMLLSPWANLENTGSSYQTKADSDPMVTQQSIDEMAAVYLNGAAASDPLASPIGAELAGLPPMLIQVGSEEVLLSDATTLAARAGAAKVPVTLEIWPDMVHVFQFFYPMLTDARAAIGRIGDWVDETLS